jgi:hypothetical protein
VREWNDIIPHDSAGVVATAWLQREMARNTGNPSGGEPPNWTPARDRPGRVGWRTASFSLGRVRGRSGSER